MYKKKLSLLLALFVVFISLLASSAEVRVNNKSEKSEQVYLITIDSGITPFISQYISQAIALTHESGAQALLINLDTPGGLLSATREIVQSILESPVPVIVYVSPAGARAGSAGVFITLAAHVAAMAPSTNIGAAHPVGITGGDVEGDMKKKVEQDASAWARSIAQARNRNAQWAEKSVLGSESITSQEALKLKVIDLMADDINALLKKSHGKSVEVLGVTKKLTLDNVQVVEYPMSTRQEMMKFLSDPNLVYILLLFGVLGLFIEFQSPGLIIPGLVGVLCLATVFGVQVLPINWFGALLILGALACFIAEIFITSFGILSAAGLTLLVFGSYLLFDVAGSNFHVAPLIIWLFSTTLTIIILAIGFALVRAKRQGPTANVDAIVGTYAVVKEKITPEKPGQVYLRGSFWRAKSQDTLNVGESVRVVKIRGTLIYAAKKGEEQQ